jgi:protein phosphatase
MRFKVGCATDIGRKRSQNQDSVYSAPELGLFVVADGMGGHRGGEIASRMVVEIVPDLVRKSVQKKSNWEPRATLAAAIENANRAIHEHANRNVGLEGMGTTTVALLFKEDRLTIGHVGDSRCYFLNSPPASPSYLPSDIWQATRDHSLVQEKLRAGLITREETKTDRMKNVITRSVGYEPTVLVDSYEMKVRAGDLFLLCSDGLSGLVDDEEIASKIQKDYAQGLDLQRIVENLISVANQNGGDDNVSVILVEVL